MVEFDLQVELADRKVELQVSAIVSAVEWWAQSAAQATTTMVEFDRQGAASFCDPLQVQEWVVQLYSILYYTIL